MKSYQLYVKLQGRWKWICSFEGKSHSEGLRKAIGCLNDSYDDKPIRIEQDEQPRKQRPN